MSWIDDTIDKFGRTIGIPGLALDEHRRVDLQLEGVGIVAIRRMGDGDAGTLLVSRSSQLQHGRAHRIRRALRLADFRLGRSWPTCAVIEDEELVLVMQIPERAFTPDALERAISDLTRLHAELDNDGLP